MLLLLLVVVVVAARKRLQLRRRATCRPPCTGLGGGIGGGSVGQGMLAGGRHATHGRPCGRTSVTHGWALARIYAYSINFVL